MRKIKVYDYLIYIRDKYRFEQLCKKIAEKFNYKCQYEFKDFCGSVTAQYTFEEEQKLYGCNNHCKYTKSILSTVAIYEEQKEGMRYLIDNADKFKDIYSFVDHEVAEELRRDFPHMNDVKDKWSWGSSLVYYYDEGYDADNPRERILDYCNLIEITCSNCYKNFTVCGIEGELDGEKLQCPHCKSVLEIGIEWEPVLTSKVIKEE